MPHSIFFHGGYAIHGSYEINRLGGPASHGCIRLHPANAATLFALVKTEGMAATTIVVAGSNSAVAPNPSPSAQPYDGWTRPGYDRRYISAFAASGFRPLRLRRRGFSHRSGPLCQPRGSPSLKPKPQPRRRASIYNPARHLRGYRPATPPHCDLAKQKHHRRLRHSRAVPCSTG